MSTIQRVNISFITQKFPSYNASLLALQHSFPCPKTSTDLLSVTKLASCLRILCNHRYYVLFKKCGFFYSNYFEIHYIVIMYQKYFPFYCWIVFCCKDILWFVYPIHLLMNMVLFSVFGSYKDAAMNVCVQWTYVFIYPG